MYDDYDYDPCENCSLDCDVWEMQGCCYNSIKMGMTAKQVHEIVGGFGEVLSQNKVAGHETVVLKYNGNGSLGSNANITIQDDKVVGKAQVGLK